MEMFKGGDGKLGMGAWIVGVVAAVVGMVDL